MAVDLVIRTSRTGLFDVVCMILIHFLFPICFKMLIHCVTMKFVLPMLGMVKTD